MPGTVLPVPKSPQPKLHLMAFGADGLIDEIIDSAQQIKEVRSTARFVWLNVVGLGDVSVLRELGTLFGLHQLALEDVTNLTHRPKVEDYGDHLFIVARMIEDGSELSSEQISLFVGTDFVLTFQHGPNRDCLDPVRARLRGKAKITERTADYLAYALLDCVIDHYFPVVEMLGDRLDKVDEILMEGASTEISQELHQLRTELHAVRRLVRPHREVVNQLLRDDNEVIQDTTRVFLRDCYDHTLQLAETIEMFREVCADLRDYHMALVSHRSNEVTKTLTIIATVFIPLSFIAGLYGMNFQQMPELTWRFGYPFTLALMATVAGGLLWWFRRRGWF
jgi:magnesium transporter